MAYAKVEQQPTDGLFQELRTMMLKAHEEAGGLADELLDEAGEQVESGDEEGAGRSVGAMHLVLS